MDAGQARDELVTDEQLGEITRRIVELCQPRRLILFGSYARGTATYDSDIDLLVIVSDEVASTTDLAVKLRLALRDIRVGKDLVVAKQHSIDQYGDDSGLLYREALAEGRTLYERG
jgi:predicted nucleotidyltransferase